MAAEIIDVISREFPGASCHLDIETPRAEHEDALLRIRPPSDDREEINDLWAFVVKLVQEAYQDRDVYLVARIEGAGVIIRDRPDRE